MWNTIDETKWRIEISNLNVSIFLQPDFVNSTANVYGLNVNYFVYKCKGETKSLISFFSKGKYIYIPQALIYTAFYIKPEINEKEYFLICDALISTLNRKYKKILLRLDPEKIDIRPFVWNGFDVDVRYTHIKSSDNNFHPSIYKNLKKECIKEYTFNVENLNKQSIKLNIDFLKEIGVGKYQRDGYNTLLTNSSLSNYYKVFNIYKAEELICSNIVLIDPDLKIAYTILLNNVNREEKYAHTFLYSSLIKWCFQNNIQKIDLCGANMKSISIFKSYFNTELKPYFTISYDPWSVKMKSTFNKIRIALKSKFT